MADTIATDSPFRDDELRTLRTLVGLIIPASAVHNTPGADDELIFMDMVNSARTDPDPIRAAIAFADALPTKIEDSVGALEAALEMAPIVTLVMQCYYRDDRVLEAIGMEARAPFPKGFALEQGDWSMLEAVQKRGKIWRDA